MEDTESSHEKIGFRPKKDHVFFVGDYNSGGEPVRLLNYISRYFKEDCGVPGFHLIRGNHERELSPDYPLENLPDIIIIRRKQLNYYITHAGMVSDAFDLIRKDVEDNPGKSIHAYRLDECCSCVDAPFRQIIWSRRGLYSQSPVWEPWPSESSLRESRACIIHGHSPYCFFTDTYSYGENTVFWKNQHVFFSEDLQSFNLDSNIKGRDVNGENHRGLSCICLEVIEEIVSQSGGRLSSDNIPEKNNGVFSADYIKLRDHYNTPKRGPTRILRASPRMKTITFDSERNPVILEQPEDPERSLN